MINQNDFESPGYEYLRSYQNMSNLYYKLIALSYQVEFCSKYKCPPIHKYYFSFPSKNKSEQQFIFNCLCAWLIKDKCHMNLELEPEEYDDSEANLETIVEALSLLLVDEDDISPGKRQSRSSALNFPISRLKQSFGPEVVWTLNILSDRALELMFERASWTNQIVPQLLYNNNKTKFAKPNHGPDITDHIIIGQDSIYEGLLPRLSETYRVDDPNLLFGDTKDSPEVLESQNNIDPDAWYDQVGKKKEAIESSLADRECPHDKLEEHLQTFIHWQEVFKKLEDSTRPILDSITTKVTKDLKMIEDRENYLQRNLENEIRKYTIIQGRHLSETQRKAQLLKEITYKKDQLEKRCNILDKISNQIESNMEKLNQDGDLVELESMINRLKDGEDNF